MNTAANCVVGRSGSTVDRHQISADRQIFSHPRQELQHAVVSLGKLHQPPTVDTQNHTKLALAAVVSLTFQAYESWFLIHLRCRGRQIACCHWSVPTQGTAGLFSYSRHHPTDLQ